MRPPQMWTDQAPKKRKHARPAVPKIKGGKRGRPKKQFPRQPMRITTEEEERVIEEEEEQEEQDELEGSTELEESPATMTEQGKALTIIQGEGMTSYNTDDIQRILHQYAEMGPQQAAQVAVHSQIFGGSV